MLIRAEHDKLFITSGTEFTYRVIWGNMDSLSIVSFCLTPVSSSEYLLFVYKKKHTPNKHYDVQNASFCFIFSEIK